MRVHLLWSGVCPSSCSPAARSRPRRAGTGSPGAQHRGPDADLPVELTLPASCGRAWRAGTVSGRRKDRAAHGVGRRCRGPGAGAGAAGSAGSRAGRRRGTLALDAARTELALSRVELDRLRDLRQRSFVSQAQLDRQQAAADAADARRAAPRRSSRRPATARSRRCVPTCRRGHRDRRRGRAGRGRRPVGRAGRAQRRIRTRGRRSRASWPRARHAHLAGSDSGAGPQPRNAVVREVFRPDPASRTFAMRLALQGDTAGSAWG